MAQMIHFHARPQAKDIEPPVIVERTEQVQRGATSSDKRIALYVIVLAALLLLALVELARAGGPEYVAGISYFNPGLAGQPVTWANGAINYYTDQGSLSSILAGTDADAFVADAFSRWTSIPTAAISVTRAGQLAEDVNGTNVALTSGGITMPADIQPSATSKPIGIVYDADGQVTDALIGTGASTDCMTNAAFGGADGFTIDGHFRARAGGSQRQMRADIQQPARPEISPGARVGPGAWAWLVATESQCGLRLTASHFG